MSKYINTASDALLVQKRVIGALILREILTLYGHTKLGYLWELIQTGFTVCVFLGIRKSMGFHAPQGMSIAMFLISGFTIWNIFTGSIIKNMGAINANKGLLAFPQVFPLDLIIARTIIIWSTNIFVMSILTCIAGFLNYDITIESAGKLILALVFSLFTGLGLGAFFSSLNILWQTTSRIVPMILRIMFFASGVFFPISVVLKFGGDLMYFNPALLLIELLRESISSTYISIDISFVYLSSFILFSNAAGLLLERYSRRKIKND